MTEQEAIKELTEAVITALEEIQQYRAIGTVEECREAVEKQQAKKPLKGGNTDKLQGDVYICAKCSKVVRIDDCGCFYCPDCGQHIDWSE